MGLFDGVSKNSGISFGSSLFHPEKKQTVTNEHTISAEALAARTASFKKHATAISVAKENATIAQEKTFFKNGIKLPKLGDAQVTVESPFSDVHAIAKFINKAEVLFEDTLTDRLITEVLTTIITESCPIEDGTMQQPAIKAYVAEMAYSMYTDMNKESNFMKLATEGKLPGFIRELYSVATECAQTESHLRFNIDRVKEECGLYTEKVNEFVSNEMANMTLLDDTVNHQFASFAAMIVAENADVIDHIKEKVTGELNRYKESATKIAEAKKTIEDAASKEQDPLQSDPVTGAENPIEGEKDGSDSSNKQDQGSGSETERDKAEGGGKETGGAEGNKTESTSGTEAQPEQSTAPGDSGSEEKSGSTESPVQGDESGAGEKSPEPKTTGEGDTTEAGNETKNTKEEVTSVSIPITEELEDASSFASANSHTFNTGDEKFIEIHRKLSLQLVDAINSGNLNELNEINATANAAIEKIKAIDEKKYSSTIDKFETLSKSIAFELNKLIKDKVTTTESARSIFDNLVLNIGTRFANKLAMEGHTPENAIAYIPADQVINESLIYYTTLETFNTLRLYDFSNKKVHAAFESFLDTVKMVS